MKRIIFFVTFMSFLSTHSQSPTSQELLQKSKSKKTVGWILLGAGSALISVGSIVNSGASNTLEQSFKGGGSILVGMASAIASIPFFLRAGKLKRQSKAMAFSGIHLVDFAIGHKVPQPVIGIRIGR